MNSYSHTLMLPFGIALAMLAVSGLVAALRLSQEVAAARQQTQAWQAYALAMQQDQSLLIVHDDGQACSDLPCCVATAERRVDPIQAATKQSVGWLPGRAQLQVVEQPPAIPVSDRQPIRGFSF